MAINSIIEALAEVYAENFTRDYDPLWIKRVTESVPESVNEWPWLYFIPDAGDVEGLALPSSHSASLGDGTVTRRKMKITHQFKAQLLVRPRRNLRRGEEIARQFIQPIITVTDENYQLGGAALAVQVISYNYGVLTLGEMDRRAVEYVGIEFVYRAIEVI